MTNRSIMDNLFVNVFPIFFSCFYFISKIGFIENPYEIISPIAFSLVLINLPLITSKYFMKRKIATSTFGNESFVFFIILLILFILGSVNLDFINIVTRLLVFSLATYSLVWLTYNLVKNLMLLKTVFVLFVAIILSMFLSGVIWWDYWHSVFFKEKIVSGYAMIDTLYHTAISNIYHTYGIVSTGIDGINNIKYYVYSHILFESLSNLSGQDLYSFYNTFYPIVFIPLCIKSFLLFESCIRKYWFKNISNTIMVYIIITIGLIGFLPTNILLDYGRTFNIYISESYLISVIYTFYLFTLFFDFCNFSEKINKKSYYLLLFLMLLIILLIGGTKTTQLVMIYAIIFWLFIKKIIPLNIKTAIVICIMLLILYISYKINIAVTSKTEQISFCPLCILEIIQGPGILLIPIYYLTSIIFILFRIYPSLKEYWLDKRYIGIDFISNKYIDCEIIIVMCVLGSIPLLFFKFWYWTAGYFADLQYYFSLLFLSAYSSNILKSIKSNVLEISSYRQKDNFNIRIEFNFNRMYLRSYSIILICLLVICISYSNIRDSWTKLLTDTKRSRSDIIINYQIGGGVRDFLNDFTTNKNISQIILSSSSLCSILNSKKIHTVSSKILEDLKIISSYSPQFKKQSALYIPRDNSYWKMLEPNSIPFLAPALTGITAIYGTPSIESWNLGEFFSTSFFELLPDEKLRKITVDDAKKRAAEFGFRNLIVYDNSYNISIQKL